MHDLATDQIWHLMKEIKYCTNLHDVSIVVNAIRHTRDLAERADDVVTNAEDCPLCAEAGLDEDVEYIVTDFVFPSPFRLDDFNLYASFFGDKP